MMAAAADFAVTVVVPLYNKARFIRATLQSVLDQRLQAAEIIVVDDQSTDDGPAIVRAMAHPNIRLVCQPNSGPGPARNRGVGAARTPWVAFLDGDDLWLPDHLEALARLARTFPAADGLATGFERRAPDRVAEPPQKCEPLDRLIDYFVDARTRDVMWTSSVALRRDAFNAVGGFGAFQPGEDFEYWARFALDHHLAVTNQPTALYVIDEDGLMHRAQRAPRRDFALQPVFATLDAALRDPTRRARHPVIAAYRTNILKRFMRNALYRGHAREARHYARLISAGGAVVDRPMRALALLPDPLLRLGMAARAWVRRRR